MKTIGAGDMRTRITVQALTVGIDADGFRTETWANVLTGSNMFRCKWLSAHGADALTNKRDELGLTATITLRYTALINQRCRVFYESDAQTDVNAWEIVSVIDIDDRHVSIEAALQKKVVA